jgi:ribonuclease HI
MKAVCNALVYALNAGLIEQGDVVLIQTDSTEAIAAFEHRRVPGQSGERDAVSFLDQFKKERNLTLRFRHVKGHSSKPGARYAANNHCDTRAKQAMRKVRAQLKEGKHVQTSGGADSGNAQEGGLQNLRPV